MKQKEFDKKRSTYINDIRRGETDYKVGMGHLNLARLYKHNRYNTDAIENYIHAAECFGNVNEVQVAVTYEEAVDICFKQKDSEQGIFCLVSAFNSYQKIKWDDKCTMIIDRIIAEGRSDIADELAKSSVRNRAEILCAEVKDLKKRLKKKKLDIPDSFAQDLPSLEVKIRSGDYDCAITMGEDMKNLATEMLDDQKSAIENLHNLEGEIREMMVGKNEEIKTALKKAKDAMKSQMYKEAMSIVDDTLRLANEVKLKEEREKREEEERKRREAREKEIEEQRLKDQIQRERDERKRKEELRKERLENLESLDDVLPELEVISIIGENSFTKDEYNKLNITLKNIGDVDIRNIKFGVISDVIQSSRTSPIRYLPIGEEKSINLSVRPDATGNYVPVDIEIHCENHTGKKINFIKNIGIKVFEKEKAPKSPEMIVYQIESKGHVVVGEGGKVIQDGIDFKSQTKVEKEGPEMPVKTDGDGDDSIFDKTSDADNRESKLKKYKEFLSKNIDGEISEDQLMKMFATLKITEKEHDTLKEEIQKQKDGILM